MLVTEITSDLTEKQIWGRRGKKLVRKYRCMGGKRKGRIVAQMAQCFAAPNICLLYTSDAADDMQCVDLGGRRII